MQKLFAECVGTFVLVFAGVGAIINNAGLVGVALAHGLAIAVAITAFAGFSDAHFNPAVSLAMFATKRLSVTGLVQYVVAQLAGAVLASLALHQIFGGKSATGLPTVATGISTTSALFAEIVATALLVVVIFAVAVDKRGLFSTLAGLPIGFIISVLILAIGPATGAGLNPARWFAPALVSGNWTNGWIYIVGPCFGALIAALSYQLLILKD